MFQRHWALLLVLCASCALKDPDFGSGPITLSPQVRASFEEYKARDAPTYFVVTESGLGAYYVYCMGGFNCTYPTARMHALDRCRALYPGEECKIYAVRRSVVWRDTDAPAATTTSQLSASDRLVQACLAGDTPETRIERCSEAIASAQLAQGQKRGAYYVRGRAFEQIGNLHEAEQDYRAVLRIHPDHAAAKARLQDLIAPAASPNPVLPKSA
ncbi:MAG TPA: hypothetical protein VE592_03985 [Geminicoccaceae bacterium]|jgi:hypothetical protein|nr:hypothetical protein [Geminicoccaceae bacterium]